MAATLQTPLPPAGGPPPTGAGQPAAAPAGGGGQQLAVTLAIVGLGIVALYFGRDILIPIALSVLLSFALGPLVMRLRRWGLPRVPAVLAVVLLAFLGLGAFGLVVVGQLTQLAQNLPTYQENVRAKIRSLREAGEGGGIVERTSAMLEELSRELREAGPQPPGGAVADAGDATRRVTIERPPGATPAEPITVRVEEPAATPFEVIWDVALPLLAPVGTAGIVVVFVIFMLLEREDLRDRLIRLVGGAGGGDLNQTTQALNETARRVSRFLLMQLVVNATYGIPIGVGLWLIGVPNALLWGVLATVLRFVPYVGPFIAALFPIVLAIAVDPGWSMLLWTVALFLGLELVSNNVVEPWLYRASTGVSTVAILIAAVFWTMLWGPVGLLLSTPLTVCLAVVGRYVPQLAFLDVLLGSEPVLSPPERLYQRMLAADPDEGEEIAEEFLEDRPLTAFYDEVGLPALRLAERDRQRKVLAGERRAAVAGSFIAVVAAFADHEDVEPAPKVGAKAGGGEEGATAPPSPVGPPPVAAAWRGKPVVCVGGRAGGLDRAAAAMLAQLLERRGIGTRVLPADAISPEGIAGLDLAGVELVCLSYLEPTAVAHARQACRRLRRVAPPGRVRLMVGLWNGQLDETKAADPAAAAAGLGADLAAASLAQAVERIAGLAATDAAAPPPPAPPPVPANEAERLAALRATGLLDTPPEAALDRFTAKIARAFGVPICLFSLVDVERQFWKSATGLPEDLAAAREAPRAASVCGHVVAADEAIVIEDTLKDTRFAGNPFLRERGIRFYAGAPVRAPAQGGAEAGPAIGTLCVIDTEPRAVSARERALLQTLADVLGAEVARRRPSPLAAAV